MPKKKKDQQEESVEQAETTVDETSTTERENVDEESTDTPEEQVQEDSGEAQPEEKKTAATAPQSKFPHSEKYRSVTGLVDKDKYYALSEALELVKQVSYAKFDASIDVHVRLVPNKKSDESVRGTVTLPNGTGKERRVVILTDELIEKIEKGWLDFDVAVTTPDMMPKVARLAKILGPKGLMPNPKSGTVTGEPEKIVEELKSGRVEFKADPLGNIHQSIGRVSWPVEKLTENYQAFLNALPKTRIKTITLAPTMGVGVKVAL